MSRPTYLDPDDDTRPAEAAPAYELVDDAPPPDEEPCRRCRRSVGTGRAYCPYCGAAQLAPRPRAKARPVARAVPVAPPRDDDEDGLPFADSVDPDDPLD